eukprot:1430395-Pyramimonas_sp.AAC.1
MVPNEEPQWTRARRPPLPATLGACVPGCHFRAQHRGHGAFRVSYLLEAVRPDDGHPFSGKVPELCKEADPGPKLFAERGRSGVYPHILAAAPVFELDSFAQPVCQWNGWITELAVPLYQALRRGACSEQCIVGAARCMIRAATHGHSMDDPPLCNFGMLEGDVVMVDAGCPP